VRAHRVHAEVVAEPAQHLRGRVLDRLVQRTGVADREHVLRGLASRPPESGSLPQRHGELDVHRDLEPAAGDFAFPLESVAVAEEEQRALHEDRQENRHASAEPAIVHVAAVRP